MKLTATALALIVCTATAYAQSTSSSKWMQEVRDYKHQMLVDETEMTDEQKEQFLPLYTEMEEEIVSANIQARQAENSLLESSTEPDDSQYEDAADILANLKLREGEIEARYHEMFKQFLSPKQLFLLQRAERHFTADMLRHNHQAKSDR